MPWARTNGSFCLMAIRVRPMREPAQRIEEGQHRHREGPGDPVELAGGAEVIAEGRGPRQIGDAERSAREIDPIARNQRDQQREGQRHDDKGVPSVAQDRMPSRGRRGIEHGRHAFVNRDADLRAAGRLIARDWSISRADRSASPICRGPRLRLSTSAPPANSTGSPGPSRGDAGLPLCAVQLAHRPHPDRIKQNEPLVRAQGISPMPYKLSAFAIGAAVTGAAGGVFTFHLGIVDPLILDFYYMQTFLIIVIIGGTAASGAWSWPALRCRRCPRCCASPPTSA